MKKGSGNIRFTIYALALVGALLLTFLLVRHGIGDVAAAVAAARWGVLAVVVFHLVPLFGDTLSWWVLFPLKYRLPLSVAFRMRWIGESVSNLVPTSAVGGEIVRTRVASLNGAPLGIAAATVLGDVTLGICVQTIFTLTGVGLLILATGKTNILLPALAGVPLAMLAVGGFYAVQRIGIFKIMGGLVGRFAKDPGWLPLLAKGGRIDDAIKEVYARRQAVAACCLCTLASWFCSSVEVWIALRAVGVPAGFDKAIILESICQGVRAAMFFIPGGLGVQEGGYMVVGGLLGIPADMALAISLIRRARELAIGIPGLLAWQFSEGHRLLRNRALHAAE
ncbi:MAG: flippase-like domain-containing protein [Chthoniobacteraceae bacterium]